MKKYMSFYHLVVEAYSAVSGNKEVFFDDYYTPQIAGTYDEFKAKIERSISDWNRFYINEKELGGELQYSLSTCCFNNGTGRSLSAQTNVQGYSVKENCPPLSDMGADETYAESIYRAVNWLKEQEPPF